MVVVGQPTVHSFVETGMEIAKAQEHLTLDQMTHRPVTKDGVEEEWKTFELLSKAAEAGVHIRRG